MADTFRITGRSYPYRERLKALGANFDGDRDPKCWELELDDADVAGSQRQEQRKLLGFLAKQGLTVERVEVMPAELPEIDDAEFESLISGAAVSPSGSPAAPAEDLPF